MPALILLTIVASPAATQEVPRLGVIDAAGTEHHLTAWKFVEGTRAVVTPRVGKGGAATELLEFCEGGGVPLKTRVVTLIPLRHIRSIEYDAKGQKATVRVAKDGGDLVLTGVTGYVGVNTVSVAAETDLGELGKAETNYRGGVSRGIRAVHFPEPEPIPPVPPGRIARVYTTGRKEARHEVTGLVPLYASGRQPARPDDALYFQKAVRIPVAAIRELTQVGADVPRQGLVFEVSLAGDVRKPLVLSPVRPEPKGGTAVLLGLLGRVEAGFKLFPMPTVGRLEFKDVPGAQNSE